LWFCWGWWTTRSDLILLVSPDFQAEIRAQREAAQWRRVRGTFFHCRTLGL
jgi:hypothetical protein